jgi:hypothetical protein
MITIPCSSCGAAVVLPVDDVSPICPSCNRTVKVHWFRSQGDPESKSYLRAWDVWRLWTIRTGLVAGRGIPVR